MFILKMANYMPNVFLQSKTDKKVSAWHIFLFDIMVDVVHHYVLRNNITTFKEI